MPTTKKKKRTTTTGKDTGEGKAAGKTVDAVKIRMYKTGTGDFFLLRFLSGKTVAFNMMIDCGGIKADIDLFAQLVTDLKKETGGVIDLLVVTHEHADHINGFEKAQDLFDTLQVKKVWFAWTESKEDKTANEYRSKYTKMKIALQSTALRMTELLDAQTEAGFFADKRRGKPLLDGRKTIVDAVNDLAALHGMGAKAATGTSIPTMEDRLRTWKVIKPDTQVAYREPGECLEDIEGLPGIRFFVLGPPKDMQYLKLEEKEGETFGRREKPSTIDLALMNALTATGEDTINIMPFDEKYNCTDDALAVMQSYKDPASNWRTIDEDWLMAGGGLALRLQQSINNTSLAMALEFTASGRVLLFPGDAEYGSWNSWHEKVKWKIKNGGQEQTVTPKDLLHRTVLYKVSHHLSQNGTASKIGMDMLDNEDLTAMATLDLESIMPRWRNTMPNDFLAAALIRQTKGKLYLAGDAATIIKNAATDRVSISTEDRAAVEKNNAPFASQPFVEIVVQG